MEKNKVKVIRKCDRCGVTGEDTNGFTYLRDGVWACWGCGSKWTHIEEIRNEET